ENAQAVEDGHVEVEDDHVGRDLADELQRLGAVAGFSDDLDPGLAGKHAPQCAPCEGRIVDEQRGDGRGIVHGPSSRTNQTLSPLRWRRWSRLVTKPVSGWPSSRMPPGLRRSISRPTVCSRTGGSK